MLDFSRLFELASGIFSNARQAEALDLTTAIDALGASGLDVNNLASLSPQDLAAALAGQGIDVASLAPSQLTELASALGVADPEALLHQLLESVQDRP